MGFPHNVPARLCATQVSNIKSNIDFKATQEFYLDLKSTLISVKQFWHKTTLILRQLKIFTLIFLLDWWNIFFNFVHIIKMDRYLIPISAKQFREVSKGCGVKYRNKIPSKELKAMLGYRPLGKRRKVEVSLETGFWKTYDTTMEAVKDFKNSHSSAIKYVIDHERPFIKRRMDKKKFWLREILK